MLLTVDDVTRRAHYRNAYRTLRRLLDLGAVPIVNENDTVATDEIRFGDNDRLAALVAALVHADTLVLLSDVDALYTGKPSLPTSRRVEVVATPADLAGIAIGRAGSAGVGTGGMVTKIEAARIATGAGIPVVLTVGHARAGGAGRQGRRHVLRAGRPSGPRSRLFWLAHATTPRGRLHLDDGAVRAVVGRRASLLPAGITGVDGRFVAGDPVDLVDPARPSRSPVAWSTTTPSSCPACSAGRPPNSPRRSGPATTARSSTATISSCCNSSCRNGEARMTTDTPHTVTELATRARVAATVLASAHRDVKDAALHAMADALDARTGEILDANAADVDAARAAGTPEAIIDRLALTAARVAAMADEPARHRRAGRSGRRRGPRFDAGQRPGAAADPGAVRRGRHDLRGAPERDRRRGRPVPEVGQRGAAARLVVGAPVERGDRRGAAGRGRHDRAAGRRDPARRRVDPRDRSRS